MHPLRSLRSLRLVSHASRKTAEDAEDAEGHATATLRSHKSRPGRPPLGCASRFSGGTWGQTLDSAIPPRFSGTWGQTLNSAVLDLSSGGGGLWPWLLAPKIVTRTRSLSSVAFQGGCYVKLFPQ